MTTLILVLVLPVEEFGAYSYAITLASLGITIMGAGLWGIAVKALVIHPESSARLVSSLMLIREAFGLAGYAAIAAVSVTSGSSQTIAATLVAGTALLARAADAPELWFQAEMRSPVVARIRITVTVALLAVRLLALVFWSSIWVFLALYVLESVIASTWIAVRYLRDRQSPGLSRPRAAECAPLVRESFPLFLSGVANQVNLRGDIILIQALLGSAAVGAYSVAARISEVAYFLPVVFMNATLPLLVKLRREVGADDPRYVAMLQKSYDQAFWYGVAIAAAAGASGSIVIGLLGPDYSPSIGVLWIHLLACPFVFMGAVYAKWIIAEGALWSALIRHSAGAGANIGLNLLLIPTLGIRGSAIATVTSYILASYLACFIGRDTRVAGVQMSLAIAAPARLVVARLKQETTIARSAPAAATFTPKGRSDQAQR
ncbi:flippase [Nocardioides sp. GY 10113]|uniref:flippase n=1 Tax=Nocardioides sp. GY 10113 TaxID=2569761 RepID=UPI001457E7EC|nr:flippase [Nocardioides sp. GY 10113]